MVERLIFRVSATVFGFATLYGPMQCANAAVPFGPPTNTHRGSVSQKLRTAKKPADRARLFAWFDSLDYDAVRSGRFVRIKPPSIGDVGLEFGGPLYGFFVSRDERRLTFLTTDLVTLRWPRSGLKDEAAYEGADFSRWVATQRPSEGRDDFGDGGEGPLTSRGKLFVFARACDARGLKAAGANYLKQATLSHDNYYQEKSGFEAQLSDHDRIAPK